jgi:predicted 2-oxoglutarate/Fe(II)-dependent dioxygenase YbiX
VRKLTVVALLQKAEEGGHLQCANDTPIGDNRHELELNVGDAVVFPSYLWHRSAPVTKGEKQSIAMWCLGGAVQIKGECMATISNFSILNKF